MAELLGYASFFVHCLVDLWVVFPMMNDAAAVSTHAQEFWVHTYVSLRPPEVILLHCFDWAHPGGWRWSPVVVFVCIPWMTGDVPVFSGQFPVFFGEFLNTSCHFPYLISC
jgi:hypothetical protein